MKTLQENLKLFYLGLSEKNEPFLYKNKDLTTHAAIIGMTGSGKTGLGITLLEEAVIDNIPSIVIDPKGDMTNLLLAFENMSKEDFLPYVDANEAQSKGVSVDEMANLTASMWKDGIEGSYQDLQRVSLYKNSGDFQIYTPKSSSGLGVSLLSDFEAPIGLDSENLNSYVEAISSSVLSLTGVDTANISSPEMLLVQTIFLTNFSKEKNISITELISQIATPSFKKIGIFDIDTFYPSEKRMALAMKINALFANPSFAQWCAGERLDISKMLFGKDGKARCNIFTISHLSDSERMFFVTILLNEIIRWMRTTEGTSSLRAILYMDEIFGFFPPTANPPSKTPMLTLLKQARAYGVGCVLSTQNPVDLDYKGLSNIGTWFIGRLQTAQDKDRVISGLTGISGSELDKNRLLELISNLKKRNFLVKNINEDGLSVISIRWALSYLKGPLSGEQISNLMMSKKLSSPNKITINSSLESAKPIVSNSIKELYSYSTSLNLEPYLLGTAKVRYFDKEFDYTQELNLAFLLDNASQTEWSEADVISKFSTQDRAQEGSKFGYLPKYIAGAKDLKEEVKKLKEYIFRNIKLNLFTALGIKSNPGESKEQFMLRLHDKCNEILEAETAKFEERLKKEQVRLEDRLKRAYEKLEKEKADVKAKGIDAAISIGSAIFGTLFGGKRLTRTNVGKAATSARSAGRVLDERADVKIAEESIEVIKSDIEKLTNEANEQINILKEKYNIKNLPIEIAQISPRRTDIFGEDVVLLWKS